MSAAIHAAALAALLLWHFAPSPLDLHSALTVVDLPQTPEPAKPPPPPPPPPPEADTKGSPERDEAAPAGRKAEAPPLAAAILPVAPPSFVPTALPSTGTQAGSGTSTAGTGSGAGGAGTGTGGGGSGNGGGRLRLAVEPEAIRGYFKHSDYPKALRETKPSGSTSAQVMVGTNGRPLSCRITRPSGIPLFDSETCRLLMARFRFRPGRDAAGQAVVAPWDMDVDWDYVDLSEPERP